MRIGILGGADIAYRMFVPALLETEGAECAGVASNQPDRRERFSKSFNTAVFENYDDLIDSEFVDAVYIPLPPALHFRWAERALNAGKHVYLEKPSTTCYSDSLHLAELAAEKHLILQENYMFVYHSQLRTILQMISAGKIGTPRLYKGTFGFPLREKDDFRYNDRLGGGALLDAGGYVIKLASILLGESAKVTAADKAGVYGYDVDMFGAVTIENSEGSVFQGAYGMDCYYQCSLEVWGSKGKISANRIFTAPPGYTPAVRIETAEGTEDISLEPDNHFKQALKAFIAAEHDEALQKKMRDQLLQQARLVDTVRSFWR